MSRREAWASAGLVFVVALVVRAWAASLMPFPTPEDATYYWGVARNLAEGHGLVSDAIWSYMTPARDPLTGAFGLFFPRPAFEIWLPLPTFLAAIPMVLLDSTAYSVALIVPVLAGALIPVLAWRLAADLARERALPPGRARTLAVGTGIVSGVALPLVLSSAVLDSTALFGVASLAASLLMTRLLSGGPPRARDPRLLGLGLVIGTAGLIRNEAVWVGLAWALLAATAWRWVGWRRVVILVAVPAIVALAVMAPWLARDWQVFGTPLPGQAVTNAFSITGFEIFAWKDPATLATYLAQGPAALLGQRADGFEHNLVNVLLVPGAPVAIAGLLALPWTGQARAVRPLLVASLVTFAMTTLAFPVQTQWGTYLHAAAGAQVLLVVACVDGLDRLLAAVGRRRGWTRPVAWLGPLFAGFGAALFMLVSIPTYGGNAEDVRAAYEDLPARLASAGAPLDAAAPLIANHPIWVAEAGGVRALALPDESVASVLDLARTFGSRILVVDGTHDRWPGLLATDPDARCLAPIPLPGGGAGAQIRAWRVTCP